VTSTPITDTVPLHVAEEAVDLVTVENKKKEED
jgi:hypothetical protein